MNLNERLISVRSPQQAVELLPARATPIESAEPPIADVARPIAEPTEALFHAPAAAPARHVPAVDPLAGMKEKAAAGALRPDRHATERLDAHGGSAPSDRPSRARRDRRGGATRPLDRGAEPSHRRDRCRRARLRAARGVARGSHGERDHGESVRPALCRAQWSTDGDVAPLHRRTPAATRDRTDRLTGRTTNRRIVARSSTPVSRTVPASTRSSLRSRSTALRSRSGSSRGPRTRVEDLIRFGTLTREARPSWMPQCARR